MLCMARNVLFKASSFWSLITKAIDSGSDSTILPNSFDLSVPLGTIQALFRKHPAAFDILSFKIELTQEIRH